LAPGHVTGGDERLGRDADGVRAGLGQPPGGGGAHGAALGGQGGEQLTGAGQQPHSPVRDVLHLEVLDARDGLRDDVGGQQVGGYLGGGPPCSSTAPNRSAVIPYSAAHRVQQRRTDSRVDTRVPSLSNRRACAWMVMPSTLRVRGAATSNGDPLPSP